MARHNFDPDVLAADLDQAISALLVDQAISALLVVRLDIAPLDDVDVPTEPLDEALRNDEPHLAARRAFRDALGRIRDALGEQGLPLVLDVEGAANECCARSCDVAYRIAVGRRAGRT